ncbi:MAG: hypothetical protein PW999_09765 [Paraburkholderia tropica]|nr:hypothetical protein [Paraburkholderia tropica]
MNYTPDEFESAYVMNVIVGAVFFALFLAAAILLMIPGFIDAVCSLFGG